jgi:hypothetical protein
MSDAKTTEELDFPEPDKAEDQATSAEDKFFGIKNQFGGKEEVAEVAVEVEVVDDRPPEDRRVSEQDEDLASYTKRVRKKINKMRAEFNEERRRAEDAQRLQDEAVMHARRLQSDNDRLLQMVSEGQKVLEQQATERAHFALQNAQQIYKKAYDEGDADQITKAQEAMTNAQLAQAYVPNIANQVISQADRNYQAQLAQQPPSAPSVPEPDPMAKSWQRENPWFGSNREMTSTAYGVHETLVKDENVDPVSADYYQRVDARMRELYPNYFTKDDDLDAFEADETAPPEGASRRQASSVVAPATRNNGARPHKVTLTESARRLSKRLGITPEQYARQVLKESNNG